MQRQTVEPHANEILAPKKIWKALDELQTHYHARDKSRVHWTTLCSPVSALHDELLISSQSDKKNSKCAVLWKERQHYACTQSKIIKIIRKKTARCFYVATNWSWTTNWRCRLFSSDITSASMVCLLNCFTCPRGIILCLGICPWRLY